MKMAPIESNNKNDREEQQQGIIPGLPDEIAELCLLHLPYPYQSLLRSVSSSWNRAITNPSFLQSKESLSRSYLFVFAFHTLTSKIQCQALDLSDHRWFLLPPMPLPDAVCPTSFATASIPCQGKLFVMGGMRSDTDAPMRTTLLYRAATNQWTTASPMPGGRSFFAAECIDGSIVAVGGTGTDIYDPESDRWRKGSGMEGELARYESAVVGGKVCVTEGWWWPFMFRPRGWVYEAERDTWREMGEGMRDGWTGVSVTVEGKLFMIAEYGEWPVKVYDEETDTWRCVEGDKFPREVLQRPYVARGLDGKMYVASMGMNVAIGSVSSSGKCGGVKVTWQVIEAPHRFHEFTPCSCQVVYA